MVVVGKCNDLEYRKTSLLSAPRAPSFALRSLLLGRACQHRDGCGTYLLTPGDSVLRTKEHNIQISHTSDARRPIVFCLMFKFFVPMSVTMEMVIVVSMGTVYWETLYL